MKVATTSDIHGDTRRIRELRNNKDKYDVVFICGDTTHNGTEIELNEMFNLLDDLGKPIILIAGNHDVKLQDKKVLKKLKSKYKNIRYLCDEYIKINGYVIYGTPYVPPCKSWGFQVTTSEEFKKHLPKKKCDILLTHTPPTHIKLSHFKTINGFQDFGFPSLRDLIECSDIKYSFCGHVHQCGGNQVKINKTVVMNVSDNVNYILLEKNV